ncbi:MAG: metal-dependent transcriptional regulator, partial [Bacillota bacterium]|nr:metal-dependent transcriptional regulator [Bacillota bacterium]
MSGDNEFRTFRGYQMLKDTNNKALSPSMEDYLEMIYRESVDDGFLRVRQLAEQLNVQAPSVTRTVKKLAELGYLKYHKYGVIQLTEKGKERGLALLERHRIIEEFLGHIGVGAALLQETELIEHHIGQNT